ncbi:MAG: FixH family protein [Candidatus Tyrphobacter sp.]
MRTLRTTSFGIGILILATALEAGCSGQSGSQEQSSAGQLHVSLAFAPTPMRIGSDTATITVADNVGKPVPDAQVVIMSAMPAMTMNVPMRMPDQGTAGNVYRARDLGNGIYRAQVDITMPTLWYFVIHARTPRGYGTALYEARLSRARR